MFHAPRKLLILWMNGSKLHEAKGRKVNVLEVKKLMYLETSSSDFHKLRPKQFKMTEMKHMPISRHSCVSKHRKSWVSLAALSTSENSIALCSYRERASAPETNSIFTRGQFCSTERSHLLRTRNEADLCDTTTTRKTNEYHLARIKSVQLKHMKESNERRVTV